MRFADLARDSALLPTVREAAVRMLEQYPASIDPLIERWMPGRTQYAQA